MALYEIEWGHEDGLRLTDVVHAENQEDAQAKAEWWAHDWWQTNKIAKAKLFKEKTSSTCTGTAAHPTS